MRPISHTLIDSIRAPIEEVFAVLTEPDRIALWLPGCDGVDCEAPLKKGTRIKVRFGARVTEFEVVDFNPPVTFGWVERGARKGWKTFFRLDATGAATAVTIRYAWIPRSPVAWARGRLFEKRRVERQLSAILENLRNILTP